MRVGFLSNQLDNRGTGNAMFDYARYNQEILGNTSKIYTFVHGKHANSMAHKYHIEFGGVTYLDTPSSVKKVDGIDVLYHIKYGNDDDIRTGNSVLYSVHSVFTNTPHGDRYATVSPWLSRDSSTPYVPHIIDLPQVPDGVDFRSMWDIPETAVVFGRYGGYDTFDISWVWEVMEKVLQENNNTWFIFANTEPHLIHPRIIYYEDMFSAIQKASFVKASDYMLHARHRGETFGISVGEFGSKGKPIITYGLSGENAHLDILKGSGYIYKDQFELYVILKKLSSLRGRVMTYTYTDFRPNTVMRKFKEVFLS